MDARTGRRQKRISKRQEDKAARDLGGRTQAASGATRLGGGADVRVMGKMRVECKITEKTEYTLKFMELEKLRKQANSTLEFPVFQFGFRRPGGKTKCYAVIAWTVGDKPAKTDSHCFTSAKQMKFSEKLLDDELRKGRLQLTFLHAGPSPLGDRIFEIMHWDDFLTWQEKTFS